MLLGTICAIVHGTALPIMLLLFGTMINAFLGQYITSIVASELGTQQVNCSDPVFAEIVRNVSDQVECLNNDEFRSVVYMFVYYFLAIALAILITSYFQVFLFQFACERQVHKIRLVYYRALLRQNVSWFDSNPTGAIASRLSE